MAEGDSSGERSGDKGRRGERGAGIYSCTIGSSSLIVVLSFRVFSGGLGSFVSAVL